MIAVFFQVPLIVFPLVKTQAVPLPTTVASSRGAPGWPSLSGPNRIRMTTTFLGAIRTPVPLSVSFFSPVTERRYVLVFRSYA